MVPSGREALAPETFRPWMALRTVVMGAATLWIAVFFALSAMQGATAVVVPLRRLFRGALQPLARSSTTGWRSR